MPTPLFNPDIKDVTYPYADIDGAIKQITLPALKITTLPKYIADNLANRLADQLVMKRGIKTNYEAEKKQLLEEILVKL